MIISLDGKTNFFEKRGECKRQSSRSLTDLNSTVSDYSRAGFAGASTDDDSSAPRRETFQFDAEADF